MNKKWRYKEVRHPSPGVCLYTRSPSSQGRETIRHDPGLFVREEKKRKTHERHVINFEQSFSGACPILVTFGAGRRQREHSNSSNSFRVEAHTHRFSSLKVLV